MWLDNILQDILDKYTEGIISTILVPNSWLEEFEAINGVGSLNNLFPDVTILPSGSNKLEFQE